jgi:hypothetical protein
MNKLNATLWLCFFAGVVGSLYGMQGQPPSSFSSEKTLRDGAKIDGNVFDFYNPILEKMCKEQPKNKPECKMLLFMARAAFNGSGTTIVAGGEAYKTLYKAGLVHSGGALKPEICALVLSSFTEQLNTWQKGKSSKELYDNPYELIYANPLKGPVTTCAPKDTNHWQPILVWRFYE